MQAHRAAEAGSAIDFRALFDAVPELYLVLRPDDPVYTIVFANRAYTQATLTNPDEIVGLSVFEVFPDNPDDPAASGVRNLQASFRQVIATKEAHTIAVQKYDIRRRGPDSGFEERYWSPVNSPILGEDGEVRFIVNRVEDVTELVRLRRMQADQGKLTNELREHADQMRAELSLSGRQLAELKRVVEERKEVEQKLSASEARFSLAFERAPIGMVLLTPGGKILEVNQAYLDMIGYSRAELAAGDSAFFTHPDDVELTRNFYTALQTGHRDTDSIEKRYFRKDGELLWTRATATMRRDDAGNPVQVIAIVEDITERKQAEVRYRFLAETIPQMVWTATPDGMLDYVNGQGTTYFAAPQEALLGAGWLQWVHPEDQEKAVKRWTQSLQSGESYETEFRLRRGSDSSWRWHLVRALPLVGDDANIVQWFGTCTDIEEQRQASGNLNQQWHTFDTALSNTPDFIYIIDQAGRFSYANQALLSLWQKPFHEAIGKNFLELDYQPDLAARLNLQIQQVFDTNKPIRDQTPYAGASGESRYYDYIFTPILNPDGEVSAVAGSTRDITEQNIAARQIEEDRRRWRELLFQTPAAIAVLRGPDHMFEWVNPDFARLVSRPAEFLIGKTVLEAVPEVEAQSYINLLNGVYQTSEPYVAREALARLDRGDGSLADVFVNFVYLPTRDSNGDVDGIFAHITDVTDVVVSRRRLEESERQFRTLAETIPHLAWMADGTGHLFWYNRRWYDYTGTTFKEIEGWGWQKLHDPKVLPDVLAHWQRALSTGEPFEMVFPLRRADGEFRTFLTRVEAIKDNHGNVVRWFGTNTDITEQRRTEEELRRMNRELEEFAYVASHDLQEPLRMVNIYTELLLKEVKGDSERMRQYSGFVQQGVLRMEALIKDLLTFSRSVHTEELEVGAADLPAALAEAWAVLKSRIEETGAVIHTEPLPWVRGDTEQLAHVFQNILSNALKYSKEGVPPEITISAARDEESWIVSIQDNGIGFDPQYAERIFGLFKRLHKEEYPGTGLGLAICKRIVERYGGRVWAESRIGEGSKFFFALPVVGE